MVLDTSRRQIHKPLVSCGQQQISMHVQDTYLPTYLGDTIYNVSVFNVAVLLTEYNGDRPFRYTGVISTAGIVDPRSLVCVRAHESVMLRVTLINLTIFILGHLYNTVVLQFFTPFVPKSRLNSLQFHCTIVTCPCRSVGGFIHIHYLKQLIRIDLQKRIKIFGIRIFVFTCRYFFFIYFY